MAHKHDEFWDRHLPVVGEPYAPGLRLREAFDEHGAVTTGVVIVLGLITFLALERWAEGWVHLLGIIALLSISFWPALMHGMGRYRVYDDRSDAPEFDGEPKNLMVILRAVANDERLWDRLAPPEPLACPPPAGLLRLSGLLSAFLPVLFLFGAVYLLLFALLALLPPYSAMDFVLILAVLLGGAVLFFPVWRVHQRVKLGAQVFGTGDAGIDGERVEARFEEVSSAELCWDRWLGVPYLLVNLYGEKVGYYSAREDPLHLLRLAKYRMPHVTLWV